MVDCVRSIDLRAVGCAAAFLLLTLAFILITACASPLDEDRPTPVSTATVEAAPTGQELFTANCAACHGPSGEGQPNWHIKKGRRHPAAAPAQRRRPHVASRGRPLVSNCQPGRKVAGRPSRYGFHERHAGLWRPAQPRRDHRCSDLHKEPVGRQDEAGHVHPRVTGVCQSAGSVPAGKRVEPSARQRETSQPIARRPATPFFRSLSLRDDCIALCRFAGMEEVHRREDAEPARLGHGHCAEIQGLRYANRSLRCNVDRLEHSQ